MTTKPEPIQAVASPRVVALILDVDTARQVAEAWEFAHAMGALDDTPRDTYLLDCAAIRRAAVEAEIQGSTELPAELVPVEVPRLRLIGGAAS